MATAASKVEDEKEYTSFWDRLTAGNIDEPGSKAYKLWNKSPEAVAEREAEAMKAGASAAAEAGIAAGKAEDAESVMTAAPNEVKSAHEAFRAEERKQFSDSFNMSDSERAAASEKEPGWDTKPDAVVAPVAAKPAVRKPVAKPVAKAPAADPVASTLKAAPVAKPTLSEELKTKAQADIASDNASKIKLPTAQPATLKQKFAADNANIKGVLVDGQPAMRPDATPAPRAKFYDSEYK